MKLYHATPKRNLGRFSGEKIRPASETGNRTWRLSSETGEESQKVYLATLDQAINIAGFIQRAIGGAISILEVEVNPGQLVADEDSGKTNWKDSLNTPGIHSCAHMGSISNWRNFVEMSYDLSQDQKIKYLKAGKDRFKLSDKALLDGYHELIESGNRSYDKN